MILYVAALLTLAVLLRVGYLKWNDALRTRCATRGHRWEYTETGTRCLRCGHGFNVGDEL